MVTTKLTDKRKAKELCAQWEAAAKGEMTATHMQQVMVDMHRRATGIDTPTFSVREFLNHWCVEKSARSAVRGAVKYRQIVAEFLCFLGTRAEMPLRQLAESDLREFVIACGKQSRARTANKKLTLLAAALRDAWTESLLPEDICKRLKKIKLQEEPPMKREPFTQEQVDAIIEKATGEWKGIVTLGAYTGQRLGDILNFRWGTEVQCILAFASRKTGRQMRVPLHPVAQAWLDANRGNHAPDAPMFPLAFAKFHKQNQNVARLSDEFHAILAALKYVQPRTHKSRGKGRNAKRAFSPLSFHSFRHYLTSELHRAGVASAIVKDIIGHESEAVHRVYTNIDDKTKMLGIRQFVVSRTVPPNPTGGAIEASVVPPQLEAVANG